MEDLTKLIKVKRILTKEEAKDFFQLEKLKMVRKTTNLFAARILADSDFPNKNSFPRFFPTPFNNFGHYFLFDYERYLRIIWDTVEVFKSHVNSTDIYLPWLAFAISVMIAFLIPSGIIVGIIFFFVANTVIKNKMRKKYADIRADLINKLLNDTWSPVKNNFPEELVKNFPLIGSGNIESKKKPIVIIFKDEHPFPGFGQLQIEELFVCRPKNKKEKLSIPEQELFEAVISEIKKDLDNSGIVNYNTGHLISIHGHSLKSDSKWLNNEKIPHLYYEPKNIFDYSAIDSNASTRMFFVVQVLLPKYMTAASFFVRVYKAENAAACQISVSTLGPPAWQDDFFQKRLAKYRSEKNVNILNDFFKYLLKSFIPIPEKNIANMQLFKELRKQKELSKDDSVFSENPYLRYIKKLDLLSLKSLRDEDYRKEYNEMKKEGVTWAGQYYYPLNWRERNSLTFTADFFGRPEAIGAVKTVYDQISRSILDSFEEFGFDVADYKDKDGNYSINADKIEHLIIGERIKIGGDKKISKKEKKEEKPKTDDE